MFVSIFFLHQKILIAITLFSSKHFARTVSHAGHANKGKQRAVASAPAMRFNFYAFVKDLRFSICDLLKSALARSIFAVHSSLKNLVNDVDRLSATFLDRDTNNDRDAHNQQQSTAGNTTVK